MNREKHESPIRASQITVALARIHKQDVFITECKNGGTWIAPIQGSFRFDAVAINRSWTKQSIRIYEVKVSRNDYLRDAKFHLYKNYCNELVIACPKGLIQKDEVPDDTGLMWYYPDSGAIKTVKKPMYRECEPDTDMLLYIIKCRFDPERIPFFSSKEEFAKAYLDGKEERRNIGYALGSKMAKEIADLQGKIRQMEAKGQNDYQEIVYNAMGILRGAGFNAWSTRDLLPELRKAMSFKLDPRINIIKSHLASIEQAIKLMEEEAEDGTAMEQE